MAPNVSITAIAGKYNPSLNSTQVITHDSVVPGTDQAADFMVNIMGDVNTLKLALDRSRARVAQLRLAVDRAIILLITGSSPSPDSMTMEQLETFQSYMSQTSYRDIADIDSNDAQAALIDLVIRPVLSDEVEELQLLHDAMEYRAIEKAVEDGLNQQIQGK